ncbi:Peptidase M48 [Rubrivivax sp. A210]|uniref:M48 family metallopeptidase n=1 Tax=Rubrivivax sp. A210 TaxID=2772301 RepID=UPI00191B15D4|nr:M48 family metallopeptidase [Rubrivivax sp. A210]CAD5371986.1 Peptidase M48 [Rubrivivax sp. A210]
MDAQHFKQLVTRLEQESAANPVGYRARVVALTLLGFAILALLFGVVGFGLLVLAGIAVAIVFSGGAALLLLLKLGKLLILLAIPLWYLVKAGLRALFVRLPRPQGRAITAAEAPALFAELDRMRAQMRGPRFHHVLVVDEVNAAVSQHPAFGLVGFNRNYLLLGLPLLESLPAEEALAVVAHEYGHLAGSHGRFSAYIYRLRHTWGTVQAYTDHIQGWLGRLVAPLVRWYAPYFNAYTFVLARADEYQADAASAQLVGGAHAAHALKRVNVVGPRHQRFMAQTFERIVVDAAPPADLMQRWAQESAQPPARPDAERWLGQALDREGHYTDSHPTLRARLAALRTPPGQLQEPPPPLQGVSAAEAWLGPLVERLRAEFQARWAEQVATPWAERHEQARQQRLRLDALRAQAGRTADEEIELHRLTLRLEPEVDLREALAAFNAAHPGHALGLFIHGQVLLDKGDAAGLALLDRACELDPEATKPACQRAVDFLLEARRKDEADAYIERWRARDALEAERVRQLEQLDAKDSFAAHGLDDEMLAAIKALLAGKARDSIAEVYIARRPIPADAQALQWVAGLRLSWWGRRRGKQAAVVQRLAQLEWPLPLVFVTLDGRFAPWLKKLRALPGARLL